MAAPSDSTDQTEAEIGQRGPPWTAHFRGSDGAVLAFTYLAEYGGPRDSSRWCVSACGLELTYLVSLKNGDVLACGVEPTYSRLTFVGPADGDVTTADIVLPPSGWLDPEPCLAGRLAGDRGCSILVRASDPADRCVREFDLRSIADGVIGAAVHPAVVTVRTQD